LRAWLEGEALDSDTGDVEGAFESRRPTARQQAVAPPVFVLRWDGSEEGALRVSAGRLKPGDVVILPTAAGGYDNFGWSPGSAKPVPDLAEEAFLQRTGRRLERFDDPDAEVTGDRLHRWSGGIVVEHFTDQARSRFVPCEVLLDRHCSAVAEKAREDAESLGLDPNLFYEAGLAHDIGKGHPGWQINIKGGNLLRLGEPPLAKGSYVSSPLSRLPKGWRHEAESLRHLPSEASALVHWLIATHHGYARPFWPVTDHGVGLAELMDRLHRDLGYWRLALHEAVLRCADRAVSREEMITGAISGGQQRHA
jgi:CRISPR-associated endonuclease/helicase Cas3